MDGKKYTFHPYELQYTIRLKTESSGFAAGEFYPTNKQTKLTYVFSNAEGNIPGVGGVCITIIYIVLGNLPFIVVQRYNRPRLQKLFAMQQRKK